MLSDKLLAVRLSGFGHTDNLHAIRMFKRVARIYFAARASANH